ncbi:hypothetical protein H0E87_008189 [Populus deltoides]|uniref:Uncharacterized protein n=1 Tax=Populus deltoides TaxID=3696 RepID=A0A8T2YZS5_POPDE|nr:hypothetical protein H0E87_008189 [Populus deltoides]
MFIVPPVGKDYLTTTSRRNRLLSFKRSRSQSQKVNKGRKDPEITSKAAFVEENEVEVRRNEHMDDMRRAMKVKGDVRVLLSKTRVYDEIQDRARRKGFYTGGCGGNQLRWGCGRRGCKYWYAYEIPNEVDSLQVQKPFLLALC